MKILITESHYKLLLENLLNELAKPTIHFLERALDRIQIKENLTVGYDEGGANFIKVGTIKKNSLIKIDYNDLIEDFKLYDFTDPQIVDPSNPKQIITNESYGIKLEDLQNNFENSIEEIVINNAYRNKFKNEYKEDIADRQRILKRTLTNNEIDVWIKRELENETLLVIDSESKSNGNQIYLILKENNLVTLFFGISYSMKGKEKEKLKVDKYFSSISQFIPYYEKLIEKNERLLIKYNERKAAAEKKKIMKEMKEDDESSPSKIVNPDDIIFTNKLINKLVNVHTKAGQGSIFAKDIVKVQNTTKLAIINYLKNNELNGDEVKKLEIKVDGIGYDLVKSKTDLVNYDVSKIKEVYKTEKDKRTDEIIKVRVNAAIVTNPLSDFKTDKMTIIFTKGKNEGEYFVITVYPGSGEGIPQASKWGDNFYVIIPEEAQI